MGTKHTINHLRRWIYEMMNAPHKYDSQAQAKIDQKLRVGDKILKQYQDGDKNVVIIQAAQINIQQSVTEIGTKALEALDNLDEQLEIEGDMPTIIAENLRRGVPLPEFVNKMKDAYVLAALSSSTNLSEAARKLNTGRTVVYEYLKRRNLLPNQIEEDPE